MNHMTLEHLDNLRKQANELISFRQNKCTDAPIGCAPCRAKVAEAEALVLAALRVWWAQGCADPRCCTVAEAMGFEWCPTCGEQVVRS